MLWTKNLLPSEIDRMPFWEFEEYIKLFNKRIEEENKAAEKEQKQYDDLNKFNTNNIFSKFNELKDFKKFMP